MTIGTTSSSSSSRPSQQAAEIPVPEIDEEDLAERYMDDLFEEIPYINPDNDDYDPPRREHNNNQETPQYQRSGPQYDPPPEPETLILRRGDIDDLTTRLP